MQARAVVRGQDAERAGYRAGEGCFEKARLEPLT